MATPADLSSAADAYTVQAQLAAAAVAAARAARPQTAESIATTVAAYQLLAAQQGAVAVPAMLAEQGISTATSASVIASSLAGYTAAGQPLAVMFESITSQAQLAMLAASAVQDAGRNGASLQMAVTPSVTGYVRMLNPPSCSRCVVLAGRKYPNIGGTVFRWEPLVNDWLPEDSESAAFQRHPQCDCRMIPVDENVSGDLTTDPQAYFDSLPAAEQDKAFGVAGAQAIRDGADISQVVNAKRGMSKGQLFGREVWHTFEGVTRHSQWRKGGRPASRYPVRLMPESIYALAKDRDDALRLLELYGYITP